VHFDPGASGKVESEQQHQLFDEGVLGKITLFGGDVKDSAKELGENIAIGFDYTKYIFAAIVVLLILYIVAKKAKSWLAFVIIKTVSITTPRMGHSPNTINPCLQR
jgi:hypothetical protein